MKMNAIKLFLIIALIGVNSIDISGENSYTFYHLTTEDGLSNNSVKAILRDSHGFLWIGTEFGLNRYDGYGFKTFLAQPNIPNTMTANNVLGLQEDGLKNIWIDFGDSYAVYNSEKDNFITDINPILEKLSVKTNGNRKIYVDKRKNLFVITPKQIYFYNVAAKKLNIYKSPKFNFSNIEVSDDLGNLYIVDSKDFCWQMEKKSGKFNIIALPTASDFDRKSRRGVGAGSPQAARGFHASGAKNRDQGPSWKHGGGASRYRVRAGAVLHGAWDQSHIAPARSGREKGRPSGLGRSRTDAR